MIKAFTAINHGKGQIDLRDIGESTEMRPTEIHLKEDGSMEDKESFCIVLEHHSRSPVHGQITMKMLNEALVDIGYKLIKL